MRTKETTTETAPAVNAKMTERDARLNARLDEYAAHHIVTFELDKTSDWLLTAVLYTGEGDMVRWLTAGRCTAAEGPLARLRFSVPQKQYAAKHHGAASCWFVQPEIRTQDDWAPIGPQFHFDTAWLREPDSDKNSNGLHWAQNFPALDVFLVLGRQLGQIAPGGITIGSLMLARRGR